MKRIGQLMPRIATWPNVMSAWRRAAKGKRTSRQALAFERCWNEQVARLVAELDEGSWEPEPYRRSVVHDPKRRVIHAPSFRDRVVHHAILGVAASGFERSAMAHSYACRLGKGSRAAVRHAALQSRRYNWYLKLDIRRFFDSIPHPVLEELLRRRFKDGAFLTLMGRIIRSYETDPNCGLPIGALTSQYLANLSLDDLDHLVLEQLRARAYVRYMDDFVLWHEHAEALLAARERIAGWLGEARGLRLKEVTEPRHCGDGLPFLGYRVMPGRIFLGARARRRFRRRYGEYERAAFCGALLPAELQRRIDALLAFVRVAECRRWRQGLFVES